MAVSYLPLTIRTELETVFDACLASKSGAVRLLGTPTRMLYLARQAQRLKLLTALDSTNIYPPESDLYARGIYWSLIAHAEENSLIVRRTDKITWTYSQVLLDAFYRNRKFKFHYPDSPSAARARSNYSNQRARITRFRPKLRTITILQIESNLIIGPPGVALTADLPIEEILWGGDASRSDASPE